MGVDQAKRQLRAAVYCRISSDREGEALGVERQRQDCVERAEREDWVVVETYTDNDVGASTRSRRKPRVAYQRMIEAVTADEVDVVVAYSNSRLTRRPLELEDLIRLHESTGVVIRTVVSGDDDLSTADGRMVARIKASVDAAEAERISERVKRAASQRKEAGLRHGGFPPFGYRNGPSGSLEVDPERAALVREAARRVLAGETLYGVYTDFNRRGLQTAPSTKAPHGSTWHRRTLKRVLTEPATIGCVELASGEMRQVADPLIDRDRWDRLRELLYDPARTADRPVDWSTRRKFVLSGLLQCGACGHTMTGSLRRGRDGETHKSWTCATGTGGCGRIRIDNTDAERWVVRLALAVLDVAAVRDALSPGDDEGAGDDLRERITSDERRLERLADDFYDDVIDRTTFERQQSRVRARLETSRTALAKLMRARPTVVETGGRSVVDVWDEHDDVHWRRELLARVVENVVVLPHPRHMASTLTRRKIEAANEFEARRAEHRDRALFERLRITWRTEPTPDDAPPLDPSAFAHLSLIEQHALWASRMDADRPVQVTGVALVADASSLLRSASATGR
ncbi:recombinase family protein [Actinomycetospora atypica]|uniref:Recombinase family protein n=1 Tax=Actinomycetospora atypica TaxID=1290095 RepID=A0ABV9YXM5_9PSEU